MPERYSGKACKGLLHCSFIQTFVNYGTKMFYNIDTCGQFHDHFTCVSYSSSKISCPVHCMQCFQNALAYFAIAISREPLLKRKAQYSRPIVLTSLDSLIFILKILFTFITKQATLTRSYVLNLPLKFTSVPCHKLHT